jgi:hypothetical protein
MRVKQEALSAHSKRVEPGDLQVNASHKDTAENIRFCGAVAQRLTVNPVSTGANGYFEA